MGPVQTTGTAGGYDSINTEAMAAIADTIREKQLRQKSTRFPFCVKNLGLYARIVVIMR